MDPASLLSGLGSIFGGEGGAIADAPTIAPTNAMGDVSISIAAPQPSRFGGLSDRDLAMIGIAGLALILILKKRG